MILVPQVRRSTWTLNGVTVETTIRCVGRSLTRIAGQPFTYRPLYTVEVYVEDRVARVRNVPNAQALAWEFDLAMEALAYLGAMTP